MASNQKSTPAILLQDSQYMLHGFPVLGTPDEKRAVKYFSLNPFLPDEQNRCPVECSYCVCHQDSNWHHHPEHFNKAIAPSDLLEQLLDLIFATPEGQRGFPISLCDYSDPFIGAHRERVLAILDALIDRKATNMVYITTKVHPGVAYLERLKAILDRPHSLRVTVFVSLPPLKKGYEQASIEGRVQLLKDLVKLGIPCCWYLRPLVEEWFDEELMWKLSRDLLGHVAHHVILSGLVMSQEIEESLLNLGLVVPGWDRQQAGSKQLLSFEFEAKLRSILKTVATELNIELGPVMGHRLCGTNGNHAYGCLLCGKQDRYCQLFQLHHYGETIEAEDNQLLKILLREQAKK
jgi:DNA repair photolyase